MMDAHVAELWEKIQAFRVTPPDAMRSFERRLAFENGWSDDYARRVVEEYRRFVLLACVAGHPVCPSEDVDAAWHLHLVYTQSYWDAFCGQTLGRPLHHAPSLGGANEEAKHREMYEQTRASYRRIFGEAPPRDVWPDADQRFGADVEAVRVKRADWWLVPRKPVRAGAACMALALLLGTAVGCSNQFLLGLGGPWDLSGPEFLKLFALLMGVVGVASFFIRRFARQPSSPGDVALADPYLLATLAGGRDRAVESAVASLVQSGQLKLSAGLLLTPGAPASTAGHALERDLQEVVREREHVSYGDLFKSERVRERIQSFDDLLMTTGHFVPSGRALAARLVTGGLFLLLAVFGATKIQVGLLRERPVGSLVMLTITTALIGLALLFWRTRPSLRGARVLRDLRQAAKAQSAVKPTRASAPDAVALAVALFGMSTLLGTHLASLHAACFVNRGGGGDGTTSGCTGGGGGGGGGCGGGGCGGCGGGGGD